MRKRVLVVEDDEDIRVSLELALEDAGWQVRTAANGRDALRAALEGPPPDAIVLDLMMPVMHGWELVAALRAHPSLQHVPLVVTSAVNDDERVSADVVLRKPYRLETLLYALERLTPSHAELQPQV
jgi:CheY-like chemotaxis protein